MYPIDYFLECPIHYHLEYPVVEYLAEARLCNNCSSTLENTPSIYLKDEFHLPYRILS